ncbi:unnamed protein product [Mytilus edulis]|uniref:Fucolectin tachylectin-4 pentraxin-1 domain-containing protein n=1 Tax=Mytilus edulis TaxID=6550 RepID=A0A8S3UE20_MYTED|nr:unnamed protein product [Mytilus edulis]
MWSLCAQLCSRIKVCKSINLISWNNTCQINDAEPMGNEDGLLESVGNSFIAASILPKEVAGPCKGHDCKDNEVCIPQSPTYACVKLLEVFVERRASEGFLVSQFKKTGQSTYFQCGVSRGCAAEAGVDGIKGPSTMFHTGSELEPFWWVNLGQVYKIQKVVSTNRIECCGDRLRKMLVHAGKSVDTSHMELCGQFLGPVVNGQVIVIKGWTFLEGQIVKLTSVNNEPTAFHLTEVEVYGF